MELKAALVGCGAMSRAWLQAASRISDLRIVGLADLDEDRAKGRAAEFSLTDAVVARDVRTLIAESRPDLLFDVVVPSARHEVVSAGLSAGCHVSERKADGRDRSPTRAISSRARKPPGASTRSCRTVAISRRVRRISRALRSGAIGRSPAFTPTSSSRPHFGGFREEMDHVLLLDMAIHGFDALRCMTGLAATGVYCREWNPPQFLVSAGLLGGGDLRARKRRRLHLSRLVVRGRACARPGNARGASSARKAR